MGTSKMSKSKAIFRSSSGPSYPYPRTHTTLMVIPSTRPLAPEDRHGLDIPKVRRRPPLNRAIPPIPESKSNESIMSHASRLSEKAPEAQSAGTSTDLVIENRVAVESFDRRSSIPRPLDKTLQSAAGSGMDPARSPRSPLLSVAHTVRNKFNQLKKLRSGSRERSAAGAGETSTSMRGSQSFSGLKQPKAVPKRIDQNANRVIKSSSMDAPKAHSISEAVTYKETKLVKLPQSNEPLDAPIEEPSELNANIVMPSLPEETSNINSNNGTHRNVTMQEDIITVAEIEHSRLESMPLPAISNSPQHIPIDHPVTVRFSETVAAISAMSLSTDETASQVSRQELDEKPSDVIEEREEEEEESEPMTVTMTEREEREKSMGREVIFEPRESDHREINGQGRGQHVSRLDQMHMQRRIEQSATSPQRYVMLVRSTEDLPASTQRTFVVATKEPGHEKEETELVKSQKIRSSKSVEVLKKTREPDAKSPERYILITKRPDSTASNLRAFVIGTKEAKSESEENVQATKKEKRMKKSRSLSTECKSPERFILISKSPVHLDAAPGIRRNNTFMIEEKPSEIKEIAQVVRSASSGDEQRRKEKKPKEIRTKIEEPEPPTRYVMLCKTPEAIRRHQTFTIGDKKHEPETLTKLRTTTSAEPIKRTKKPVRQHSQPEEAKSPERFILVCKTPEAIRKHNTFTIGVKSSDEPLVATSLTTTTSAEPIKPKYKPKRQLSEPEETKSPERYILLCKTPETIRRHQTFTIGEKDLVKEATETALRTSISTEPVVVKREKLKKEKRARSQPEESISPTRYILKCKTPETIRRHQTFTIGEKDQSQVETAATMLMRTTVSAEPIKPKVKQPVRQRSQPEESTSPPRYILTCKTPETIRRFHTFSIGEKINDEPIAQVQMRTATSAEPIRKKCKMAAEKRTRSQPEESLSPPRYILTCKTPDTIRRHQTFTIGEKSNEEQSQVQMRTAISTEPIKAKKKVAKAKVIRQSSQPERLISPERYILVTRTPQPIRRNNTFYSIGERPRSPDVPWIEDGEITEPIATVGPSAERKKRKEAKEAKERERKSREKSQERYILTTTTPMAMRKFNTFTIEPKSDDEKENRPSRQRIMQSSVSAEPVLLDSKKQKQKHVSRSESSDSKRHSYLKRLHMEIFGRGRSKEKKSETAIRRQQSLDDTAARRSRYATTTPIVDRKYQTFLVESHRDPTEALTQQDEEMSQPVKPIDMYTLTTMTPILPHKEFKIEQKERPMLRDLSLSPERGPALYVMGGRKPIALEQENPKSKASETARKEEKGEMTSPEEEIPMDTQMSPMEEDESRRVAELPILTRPIKHDIIISSPIVEDADVVLLAKQEDETKCIRNEPVFKAPSPPSVSALPPTVTRSTSPLKAIKHPPAKLLVDERKEAKETKNKGKLFGKKNDDKHAIDKDKSEKSIAALSIKNAGKRLTPSFFRRNNNRKTTCTKPSTGQQRGSLQLRMGSGLHSQRRAPLAESEPSVVADSPLVENLPLTFEKWDSSPRTRLRHNGFVEPITEEQADGNGNVRVAEAVLVMREMVARESRDTQQQQQELKAPPVPKHKTEQEIEHERGLIDDEILDQPMLVGDTFSHSSSVDGIASQRKSETVTIASLDRSNHDDAIAHIPPRNRESPSRRVDQEKIDESLDQVEHIKAELTRLQHIVQKEMGSARGSSFENEKLALIRENDSLRRQLKEKDQIIDSLRRQIAELKAKA